MKILTIIFVALIALLQYPLWLGKGSWLRVWDLNHQISAQAAQNASLKTRNDTLMAEVKDLKQGFTAVEERARSELGMVKQKEIFYQVLDGNTAPLPAAKIEAKPKAEPQHSKPPAPGTSPKKQ